MNTYRVTTFANTKRNAIALVVFLILIGGFILAFSGLKFNVSAAGLAYCIKNDYTDYITIDDTYYCPSGYFKAPADFNLNLLVHPTSTLIWNYGTTTASTSSSTKVYYYNYNGIVYATTTDLSGLNVGSNNPYQSNFSVYPYYPTISPYTPYSYPTSTYPYTDYQYPDYPYNGTNYPYTDYSSGSYSYSSTTFPYNYSNPSNLDPYNVNPYINPYGTYTNPYTTTSNPWGDVQYIDQNGQPIDPSTIYIDPTGNPNILGVNPSGNVTGISGRPLVSQVQNISTTTARQLESGRFLNLDQLDYKYCVLLNKNMGQGSTDANSGKEVSALQAYLYDRGYLDYKVSGVYDMSTSLAVAKFQYRNQIIISGNVDPMTRYIIKTITCKKYPKVSYEDKPISPAPAITKSTTNIPKTTTTIPKTTTKTTTNTKPKPPTTIPETTPTPVVPSLSDISGDMYLSKMNNLYFLYISKAIRPYICITLNNTNCSLKENFAPVAEGVLRNFFETANVGNSWVFTLYNGPTWGEPGNKVKIYLKDSQNTTQTSIYTVNVLN